MELRQLGQSPLEVSAVGLGGNTFGPPRADEETSIRTIREALDLGVNFIDTAIVYGEGQSEIFIGKAIKDRRDQVVIATKFLMEAPAPGSTAPSGGATPIVDAMLAPTIRERILGQAEESMRKLGSDYIDLYQLAGGRNAPGREAGEEMLEALDTLVKAGKVRAIGTVGAPAWRVAEIEGIAHELGVTHLASAQNSYNILDRNIEQELVPCCRAYEMGVIPFAPLAGGFLTGKYQKGQPPPPGTRGAAGSPLVKRSSNERNWEILPRLERFAAGRGHTLGELAIAWLMASPLVASVIAGASNDEQVRANVAASEWTLTQEEMGELDAIAPRVGAE